MAVPKMINEFVTRKRPAAFCDKCIADALGMTNKSAHPAQITNALGTTSDFTRTMGICFTCGAEKVVIRAN